MQVTRIPPSARLAPFVERFIIVESRDEVTRMLLPAPGLILGVRYRGASSLLDGERVTRLSGSALTGLVGSARRMRTHPHSGIVLAQFRPGGAARFFSVPLHELFGAMAALDDLLPRAEVQRLSDRIAGQPDHAHKVAVLEQFLLARLTAAAPDPIAHAAVAAIVRARGSLRIADLARSLGISQDPLEKRFRREVGASPKQLASIIRVQHAIDLGRTGTSWSRVAHDAGYFDQSHFIREFRTITGEPPARFFRAVEYC
jgi:AraC-like DNA-binding protein